MKRVVVWGFCAAQLAGCASLGGRSGTHTTASGAASLYTDCSSALVVGLRWDPPVGSESQRHPIRYTVTRDGSLLGSTSETNFVDTTVAASAAYDYSVSAALVSGETLSAGTLRVSTPAASPTGDAPYCKSRHIDSISWDWAGGHTEPNGSDLWPVTWGKDGNVYTFFGDGGGFGGDNQRGRVSFGVAMLTAAPPLSPATVKNIYGGYQASHPAMLDGKAGAIIAVGNDFYTLGGLYDAQELRGVSGHKSGAPKRVQLGYSKGNAHSWQAAPWIFCSSGAQTAYGAFCPVGFVNYGRGNAGAPDDDVYLLGNANSPGWWEGDDGPEVMAERQQSATSPSAATTDAGAAATTYLARVSKKHVLQRAAYRYFAGLDSNGQPIWSDDQKRMQPIFTDRNPSQPGCDGRCYMTSPLEGAVYDPGIHRYIATAQGAYIGQTSFYDAPHPWGPWTTISYNNIDPQTGTGGWANLGKAGGGSLGVHIVNAWTSADGLSLWLTYSSDGKAPAGALFPPEGTMLDSFNLVSARLILATTPAAQRSSR
jgi:hypothetical protein